MSELEQMRAALTPNDLRRLGISVPLMSDFEFIAAVGRDARWSGDVTDDMAAYDRRGLLNVIAVLAAEPRWPSGPDAAALVLDGMLELQRLRGRLSKVTVADVTLLLHLAALQEKPE